MGLKNTFNIEFVLLVMEFMKCTEIERLMNDWGAAKRPFLFGIDYELKEGFFVSEPLVGLVKPSVRNTNIPSEAKLGFKGATAGSVKQQYELGKPDSESVKLHSESEKPYSEFVKPYSELEKTNSELGKPDSELVKQPVRILFDINGAHNIDILNSEKINLLKSEKINKLNSEKPDEDSLNHSFKAFPEDYSIYKKRFETVYNALKRGNSSLVNLTIGTRIEASLSMEEIFNLSSSRYKIYVPERFVCFSPECFVRITDGKIVTFPMKGTIDANLPNAEEMILGDEKELEEHRSVVDLMCADIGMVANDVKVNRFRFIDEVTTNRGNLLQVSSEIEGSLPVDYLDNIGTIIFKLLPAGSISGAPKESSLKIIKEAERSERGFYTGIAGYFDGYNLDSFVLIRFIEQNGDGLVFRSGGGITAMSKCSKEYDEAIRKVYLPF